MRKAILAAVCAPVLLSGCATVFAPVPKEATVCDDTKQPDCAPGRTVEVE